jgi:hypothetical protein
MTQMDARIFELVARLAALEHERAEILAEINTLRSVRSEEAAAINAIPSIGRRSHRPEFGNRKEDCSVSPAFPRPFRCLPYPLGESRDGTQRLRTCLCE